MMPKDYLREAKEYIKAKFSYSEQQVDELSIRTILSLIEAKAPEIHSRLITSLRADGYDV